MWLFIKNAFVSVVEAHGESDMVLVRARKKKHLETFLPAHQEAITDDQGRDYRFRVKVSKELVAERIAKYVTDELTYGNFKGAQDRKDQEWTHALHEVWGTMYQLQKNEPNQ